MMYATHPQMIQKKMMCIHIYIYTIHTERERNDKAN